MSARIEGVKPPLDDAYRGSERDPGRLIIERRWRETEPKYSAAQAMFGAAWWTTITVDPERIIVIHGPIPTLANREIDWRDVAELCSDTGPEHTFALFARLHDGRAVDLMSNVRELEICEFAEAEILAYFKRTRRALEP